MTLRCLAFVVALSLAAVFVDSAWAASAPPSRDSFYAAPARLAAAQRGSVLRSRRVNIALGQTTVRGTQVLYRTTNQLGQPAATAATILRPVRTGKPTRLLSYQTAYDGLADTCRPSYALRTGDSGGNAIVGSQSPLINAYLGQGDAVVTSDYEGPSDDFGAGRESGYGTLDAIRAAEHELGLDAQKTPVGLDGYSGGSIASMWAAQLQPRYARELHIVGVAAGGIPADFAHNTAYIDGSKDWAGAIPAVTLGLARAYRMDLGRLLNARGRRIIAAVSKGCLVPSAYPGLKLADLLKARYKNYKRVPELVRSDTDSIMGRSGTPAAPLFLGVGNNDGTGDGVMVAKDVEGLAHTYCARGLRVQFHEYVGQDHVGAAIRFEPEAVGYLQALFAAQPPPSDCPIPAGNPLTPLPTPPGAPHLTNGVLLSAPHHAGGHYTVLVSAPTSTLTKLTLDIYRVRGHGRPSRIGTTTPRGAAGFQARRLRLPIESPIPGERYRIVVTARLQTAPVHITRTFRAQ